MKTFIFVFTVLSFSFGSHYVLFKFAVAIAAAGVTKWTKEY